MEKVCACGLRFPVATCDPIAPEKAGTLREVTHSDETKEAAWKTILLVAKDIGADEGWARGIYEARFGEAKTET
jgi:hypothetical protein